MEETGLKKMEVVISTGGHMLAFQDTEQGKDEIQIRLGEFIVVVDRHRFVNGLICLYGNLLRFKPRPDILPDDMKDKLTPRETDVLRYLIQGYTNRQIGKKLVISHRTVETHRRSIYIKLDVKNRRQLFAYIRRHNVI